MLWYKVACIKQRANVENCMQLHALPFKHTTLSLIAIKLAEDCSLKQALCNRNNNLNVLFSYLENKNLLIILDSSFPI